MHHAKSLGLAPGNWLVSNCSRLPSENNCKLVIMAPLDQKEDLLNAGVAHAMRTHGHTNAQEVKAELDKGLETVTI